MTRVLGLVLLSFLVGVVVGCGGTQVPAHNGYKGKKPRPWAKPKVLKLKNNEAKLGFELDYARYKRARWLAVDLPGPGRLTAQLEVTPSRGVGGVDEEGEELDMDVGFEILDGTSFAVLAASNLDTADAHQLKKELELPELPEGRYLVHVYLEGRLHAADIDVKLDFKRGDAPWKSDFPNQVAFVGALAAIPPIDDTPEETKKRVKRVTVRKRRGKEEVKEEEPEAGKGGVSAVMAPISDTQPGASGGTMITIAAGTSDGLENGLSGSIRGVRNSSFKLTGCGPSTCRAKVRAPIDDVRGVGAVIVKLKAP